MTDKTSNLRLLYNWAVPPWPELEVLGLTFTKLWLNHLLLRWRTILLSNTQIVDVKIFQRDLSDLTPAFPSDILVALEPQISVLRTSYDMVKVGNWLLTIKNNLNAYQNASVQDILGTLKERDRVAKISAEFNTIYTITRNRK